MANIIGFVLFGILIIVGFLCLSVIVYLSSERMMEIEKWKGSINEEKVKNIGYNNFGSDDKSDFYYGQSPFMTTILEHQNQTGLEKDSGIVQENNVEVKKDVEEEREERKETTPPTILLNKNDTSCHDPIETYRTISDNFALMYLTCTDVLTGTHEEFYNFSSQMQKIKNIVVDQGSMKDLNNRMWNSFENGLTCHQSDESQLIIKKTISNTLLMRQCFDELENKFGSFPMSDLGDIPVDDVSQKSPSSKSDYSECEIFCDSNYYEPFWVKGMGPYQAAQTCTNIMNDWESATSNDIRWCTELSGFLLDGGGGY